MTAIMDGQGCLFDPVTASLRMYRDPYPATTGKTSKPSSRSSQGSGSRTLPMCLCLRRENGPKPGASTMNWGGGPLPIASMTHSIGEFRSDADGFLSLPISTVSQRRRFYLTLNCGEKPRIPNPTKLSEILVENPDEKYRLSAKACQGILNRAERRGKELPPELKAALEAQSLSKSEPVNLGGAKESSFSVSTQEPSQPSTTRAYSIQGNTIDRDAKQNGGGISLNVAHTLDSADRHGVMAAGFSFGQSEKARSLRPIMSDTIASVVRRLTPLECERIQGFPDNWSKYGLYEDGKVKELSDSARYRLQGNSIARPFWSWLTRRIAAQYETVPTLGSLFDGQGGFPLCWEEVNGKGTARWASEIEKDAVAVTKYHFPEREDAVI